MFRCIDAFRMTGDQMVQLCQILEGHVHETHKLPLLVQLSIFLDLIAFGHTYREQKDKFKIAHKLIKIARRNIAKAIVDVLYPLVVRQPTSLPNLF